MATCTSNKGLINRFYIVNSISLWAKHKAFRLNFKILEGKYNICQNGVILGVVSENGRFDPLVHGNLMGNLFHRKEWKKCYKIDLVSESPRGGANKVSIHP